MPLPKAPTKPASLLEADDTLLAKAPLRGPLKPKLLSAEALTPSHTSPTTAKSSQPAGRSLQPRPAEARQPSQPITRQPQARPSSQPGGIRPRQASQASTRPSSSASPKLFVLDTNVLMHDPSSLFRFQEHDVYLPMMTLEELDGHKKGLSEVSRHVRQVSRSLDSLIEALPEASRHCLSDGIPLASIGHSDATGRLFFQTEPLAIEPIAGLATGKADNQILGVVRALA
ncbi:MAG: PIN domain-containing protein, partial [Burkholderiaceae bacterium]